VCGGRCSAICTIVVIARGTLIGIIGTVGANLPMVGVTLVGVLLAAGWAVKHAGIAKRSKK
jgi:hypothetical protein